MFINNNKTHTVKENYPSKWYIIDAQNKTLGRISSKIAYVLKGKNCINYTPNQQSNIYIIVINSKLIHVTGKKREQIIYKRHSGRPGGLKQENFNSLQARIPNRIIEKAIKGMLPKNKLGRQLFKKLKVYEQNNHPHLAQKPIILE
uniref:Ribosomal protein L13 n=1 Tax=Plumaria plumosa TaxID=189642 RepID=A0A4D6X2I8_9FLOR|nr:ribosomal protein L13 [Plumaria plumosa]